MKQYIIGDGINEVKLAPTSGQILQWTHQGEKILYEGSSSKRSGIPILFPYANPLENDIFVPTGKTMPSHGFGRLSKWEYQNLSNNSARMTLSYESIDHEWQEAYPYQFVCEIEISVQMQSLTYTLSIHNTGNQDMPIAPGIHPYFPIYQQDKKKLRIEGGFEFDRREIDWTKPSSGSFYDFKDDILVCFPKGRMIEIAEKTEPRQFEHFVIWSQTPSQKDYDFVCIEPFTKKTNAINKDPIIVRGGEKWNGTIVLSAF